jgi:hypothetical protein
MLYLYGMKYTEVNSKQLIEEAQVKAKEVEVTKISKSAAFL